MRTFLLLSGLLLALLARDAGAIHVPDLTRAQEGCQHAVMGQIGHLFHDTFKCLRTCQKRKPGSADCRFPYGADERKCFMDVGEKRSRPTGSRCGKADAAPACYEGVEHPAIFMLASHANAVGDTVAQLGDLLLCDDGASDDGLTDEEADCQVRVVNDVGKFLDVVAKCLGGCRVLERARIVPRGSCALDGDLQTRCVEHALSKATLKKESLGAVCPADDYPECYGPADVRDALLDLLALGAAGVIQHREDAVFCARQYCGNAVAELGEACDGIDDEACPGACTAACTCPAVTRVYVYRSAADDVFGRMMEGVAWNEAGLLDPDGRAATVSGDDLVLGGATVGRVMRNGGAVVGYEATARGSALYDLGLGAAARAAFKRIRHQSGARIDFWVHGRPHEHPGQPQHLGGVIELDGGRGHEGFSSRPGFGGTGLENLFFLSIVEGPYFLPVSNAELTIAVGSCYGSTDPDGAGAERSVSSTLSEVAPLGTIEAYDGEPTAYFDVDTRTTNEANRALAKAALEAAAMAAGRGNDYVAWLLALPITDRSAQGQAVIDAAIDPDDVRLVLRYRWEPPAAGGGQLRGNPLAAGLDPDAVSLAAGSCVAP